MRNLNEMYDEGLPPIMDIWIVFRRNWRLIIAAFVTCAFLGGAYALTQPVTYTAQATFRVYDSNKGENTLFSSFGIHRDTVQETISLMKTHSLMKPVVSRLGLQASFSGDGFVYKSYGKGQNFCDNVSRMYNGILNPGKLPHVLDAPQHPLSCVDVYCEGDMGLSQER